MKRKFSSILSSLALTLGLWVALCAPLDESVAFSAPGPVTVSAPQPAKIHRLPVGHLPAIGNPAPFVLKPADIPEENWERGHRGVDIKASPGDEIVASAAGTVAFVGVVAGTPVVSVDHRGGLRTTYEPVRASVRKGQKVWRGEVLGVLADAARLPKGARRDPGLSWGAKLRQGETPKGRAKWVYLDPLELIGAAVVRLIPVGSRPAGEPG